jgi:hypothetical protein
MTRYGKDWFRAEEVLRWCDTTPHHKAMWAGHPSAPVFLLIGHRTKIQVDHKVWEFITEREYLAPGGEFDRRMFRPTRNGKQFMTRVQRVRLKQLLSK